MNLLSSQIISNICNDESRLWPAAVHTISDQELEAAFRREEIKTVEDAIRFLNVALSYLIEFRTRVKVESLMETKPQEHSIQSKIFKNLHSETDPISDDHFKTETTLMLGRMMEASIRRIRDKFQALLLKDASVLV